MEPDARALREGKFEVTTSLGLYPREVLVESAQRGADATIAYADRFGEALAALPSMQLLLAYRTADSAAHQLASRLRPEGAVEVPVVEEPQEPGTRGAWSNLRSVVARAAQVARARDPAEQAVSKERERLRQARDPRPAPSASWPDVDILTRRLATRLRARKYRPADSVRPIYIDSAQTVTPPASRTIDEILGDDAPRPFLRTYGVAYDGIAPADLPAYVRRKLLESTGDAPGATETFAIEALRAFAEDGERLRATVNAILKSPIDPSAALKGHLAKALHRLGERARAEALVEGIEDPDARVLAADIAEEHRDLPRALALADSAAGERLETLGAVERVARWRQALSTKREPPKARSVIPLRLRGEPWTIVLEEETVLGRVHAAIIVASPLVSRRHAVFRRRPGGAEVEDVGSQHGTYVDGKRLAGPLWIERAHELRLADTIPCKVRPATPDEGGAGVVLDVAERRWLLPLASAVELGTLRIERTGTTLTASAREGAIHVDGGATPRSCATVDLFPGARIRLDSESSYEVELDDDAFDL